MLDFFSDLKRKQDRSNQLMKKIELLTEKINRNEEQNQKLNQEYTQQREIFLKLNYEKEEENFVGIMNLILVLLVLITLLSFASWAYVGIPGFIAFFISVIMTSAYAFVSKKISKHYFKKIAKKRKLKQEEIDVQFLHIQALNKEKERLFQERKDYEKKKVETAMELYNLTEKIKKLENKINQQSYLPSIELTEPIEEIESVLKRILPK